MNGLKGEWRERGKEERGESEVEEDLGGEEGCRAKRCV